jgi:hypothetical protein
MTKILGEDYTASVLCGIPVFCVNRNYECTLTRPTYIKHQYIFKFPNGYGASIIEFVNRSISNGAQYELCVSEVTRDGGFVITYNTSISSDVERGNALDMHELLNKIEILDPIIS